ncbi:MAG TPA: hypothetical protein PL044_03620 [Clostridiales bacterium]|nr:MAG: hypothetical protein BWY37_02168 [Firmicutes bacterium ADurb.Bin262]HOU09693.1 hypothetical protein [Clostridiales bacterium]HQH63063.1 hypothetical protein [Clostridiales bacterium]HQK72847.1 hypothetical protein [Clostridiales bacterium]
MREFFAFDVINLLKRLLGIFLSLLLSFGVIGGAIPAPGPDAVETSPYFMAGDGAFLRAPAENAFWSVGFAKKVITPPDVLTNPGAYYMAGYANNKRPAEVMDDTFVRTVYIDDNSGRGGVLFAVIDAIGLSNKEVLEIRQSVWPFVTANHIKSVNVLCTHNHAGIDTQGLWGNPYLLQTGRNEQYNAYLKDLVAQSMKEAFQRRVKGNLYWGEITPQEDIFNDNRDPYVYEKSLTRLRFTPAGTPGDRSDDLYICALNAHPEMMAVGNTSVSADYPAYMGRYIAEHTGGTVNPDGTVTGGADFVLFNGAIGALINGKGLGDVFSIIEDKVNPFELSEDGTRTNIEAIAAKMRRILGVTGEPLSDYLLSLTLADLDADGRLNETQKNRTRKAFTVAFGRTVGRYICEIDGAGEYPVAPFVNIRFEPVILPVDNYILTLGAKAGLVNVNAYKAGDFGLDAVITTEGGILELGGSLRFVLAPGELAPELAMGGYLPAQASANGFEMDGTTAFGIIDPGRLASGGGIKSKNLVLGLVNDEIGYIIPENDFYVHRFLPYVAQENDRLGRGHYEETVSAGPKTAGILLEKWQTVYDATHQ